VTPSPRAATAPRCGRRVDPPSIVAIVPDKKADGRPVPQRSRSRAPEPADTGAKLAKEGRLWLLSLVCALGGAIAVWRTGSLAAGVTIFLLCVTVLGGALLWYERRRR
jgi:hypothetical protein